MVLYKLLWITTISLLMCMWVGRVVCIMHINSSVYEMTENYFVALYKMEFVSFRLVIQPTHFGALSERGGIEET